MSTVLVFAALAVLVSAVAWRPHGLGPAVGALGAVALTIAAGVVGPGDLGQAVATQWRPYVTLLSIMAMTSAAERMGLLDRLASWIEPRTRGPVRHAFRVTFVLSALVAAVLSNDAAILLMTPTVIVLLRTVYPRRHPQFVVPFVFAVFASAGVAPLVISNPMNLIFADHVGLGFNTYSATMIPIAIAGWVAAYLVLVWLFRGVLTDEAPALGAWAHGGARMSKGAIIVLVAVGSVLAAYPVVSYLGAPLWPVALSGGVVCTIACLGSGQSLRALSHGIAWPIFPFLLAVFVLALALARIGVVDWVYELYASSDHPIATIGTVSALGSAVLNNHSMSLINALALDGLPPADAHSFAALIGGDLGPRLLPIGSLASLLWYDLLRKHDVEIGVPMFIRVGIALTVPTMIVSLGLLWLLG